MKSFILHNHHLFSWVTLLDVTFCTLIVRMLLGWLIGNQRLARLLLILLGLATFFFFVQRSNLMVTQILTTALIVPAACLVVLSFLPDLRRAYQTASLRQLFASRPIVQDNPIPALAAAIVELARVRCGTLLIFPKGDDVDAFLNGGEEYDALVTKSLLLSICHPDCPRHDGAIMIRGSRIVRVGAVLPLSVSDPAREEWGTRHLAALGLTEQCDADVIVISEERGTVSHARRGLIREVDPLNEKNVARLLESIFVPNRRAARRRTRREHLISLLVWAAAFLIAAIAVPTVNWLNRPTQEGRSTNLMVAQAPIFLNNVPDGLYLETNQSLQAQVYLRVPSNRDPFFNANLGINVDLKDYPPGLSTITLTAPMIGDLPPGWEIERYLPEQISISLARSRDVPIGITPRFIGLAPGLRVVATVISPPLLPVRIKDNRAIQGLTLQTLPVDLSGVTKTGSYKYQIDLDLPPAIQPLKGYSATVKVRVQVEHERPLAVPVPAPPLPPHS